MIATATDPAAATTVEDNKSGHVVLCARLF